MLPLDLRLRPLEIAAGLPFGPMEGAAPLPPVARGEPVDMLERAVQRALQRVPCVVSFSGGRDSSAVLALAAHVARRDGLPPPIPMTLRFPGAPEADESHWQEAVVRHLQIDDWERVDVADSLDLVGPVAADVLRRHGLLWPPNTHFHQPILDRARGGSILTGIDGDGVFASWSWRRAARVLNLKQVPRLSDAPRLMAAVAPKRVRALMLTRQPSPLMPWLTLDARRMLFDAWASEGAAEPARWHRWVDWFARRRGHHLVLASFELLATDDDVLAVHPFSDPEFLRALGTAGGRAGFRDRTAIMRQFFGSLLPEDVLSRQTKAHLDAPFWNRHSRAFVASWDGTGVTEFVDEGALRTEWSQARPNAQVSTLLQAAWLHGLTN